MKGIKYLRICTLLMLVSPCLGSLEAGNVVFVGDIDGDELGDGSNSIWAAADTSMVSHLTNVLGHAVTSVDDSMVTATAVAGADFIVVSATASSGAYGINDSGDGNSGATNSLGTDATIILMESGTNVVIPFGLAGSSFGTHIGTDINILALDDYITKGFAVGTISIYNDPEFGGEEIRGFATKPPNGTNAGFPQFDWTGDAVLGTGLVAFEPVVLGTHRIGDNLIVAFPFGNGGFDHLTADGLKLFDNVFSPPSVPGDYNGNGIVDAADYVVWRNGDSPDSTIAGYNLWKANFGKPGSGAGTSLGAVPEPISLLLFVLVGVVLLGARRTERKVLPR